MDQLRTAGPNLLKRLIEIANAGDVPALRVVLAPLIAAAHDNPVRWKFGKLADLDDLRMESERILRGIESGMLTPEQGIKLRTLLDGHAANVREAQQSNVRERFELDQRLLSKARADHECWSMACAFVMRLHSLDLPAAAWEHPAIAAAVEVAKRD